MVKIFALAMTGFLAGCVATPVKPPIAQQGLVGCYAKTDDIGYNSLELTLKPDLTYSSMQGDIGSWGIASGHWQVSGNIITLTPDKETERMVGFLRELSVWHAYGRYSLRLPQGWG